MKNVLKRRTSSKRVISGQNVNVKVRNERSVIRLWSFFFTIYKKNHCWANSTIEIISLEHNTKQTGLLNVMFTTLLWKSMILQHKWYYLFAPTLTVSQVLRLILEANVFLFISRLISNYTTQITMIQLCQQQFGSVI